MGRIFGTDGARGVAGKELTAELAMNLGRAAGMVLTEGAKERPSVLIGCDTRISCPMLEAAVSAGFCSVGVDVIQVGVVPTPAVAFLVVETGADAGVMISASHNPFQFNGIKLFSRDGYKLPDAKEEEIEAIILDHIRPYDTASGAEIGRVTRREELRSRYTLHLASASRGVPKKLRVLVDCAQGSASTTAGELFSMLDIDTDIVHAAPNGTNINANCGSMHVDELGRQVAEGKYDLGLAFDGDADRLLAVDEHGKVVDGDTIMAILADYLKERDELSGNTLVVTTMSNLGLLQYCKSRGIATAATKVGDRYVLEKMLSDGFVLGGEQSGHVIFLQHATTGDGQLTAVMLFGALAASGKSLSQLAGVFTPFPQIMRNVRATPAVKAVYAENEAVARSISAAGALLGDEGRVIVRPSGTEPMIRVMLEGRDLALITTLADAIARAISEVEA